MNYGLHVRFPSGNIEDFDPFPQISQPRVDWHFEIDEEIYEFSSKQFFDLIKSSKKEDIKRSKDNKKLIFLLEE